MHLLLQPSCQLLGITLNANCFGNKNYVLPWPCTIFDTVMMPTILDRLCACECLDKSISHALTRTIRESERMVSPKTIIYSNQGFCADAGHHNTSFSVMVYVKLHSHMPRAME